jgi:uncharacterized delta-60 repeat protein
MEPGMRRSLFWLLVAGLLGGQLAAAGPAAADPGRLDPGFGTGGKTTTRFAGDAGATAAVLQDGKVVAAGFAVTGATTDFALTRYRPNGTLDTSFGNHGRVTTDIAGGAGDQATALAVQADGKLVAAGLTSGPAGLDFALVRYWPNGALDPTFGDHGRVITDFAGGADAAHALVVQADGKLVAAGSATVGTNQDFAIARYNRNGTPDLGFGTGGRATIDIAGAFDEARALVLQGGRPVAAGFTFTGDAATGDFALARFTAAGRPDGTFGTGGRVTTDFAGGFDDARALVVQGGKLVAAGGATTGSSPDFALARYDDQGSLDPTFGTGGKVTTDFAPVFGDADEINALVVQQGKLVAAGSSFTGGGLRFDFALARYRQNGDLDATFGTRGTTTTDFARREDRAQALVLQGGRPVAVGSAVSGSGQQTFALARYQS